MKNESSRLAWSEVNGDVIEISSSCCNSSDRDKNNSTYDLTFAFIGNPSVGKSVFFSRLTGVGVE
ncbi:MAG: hypothetical protein QUS12_06545, partial [Methanosarcina sp.]|nr:hypothetical protein [Methanosarcina sp.]